MLQPTVWRKSRNGHSMLLPFSRAIGQYAYPRDKTYMSVSGTNSLLLFIWESLLAQAVASVIPDFFTLSQILSSSIGSTMQIEVNLSGNGSYNIA